MKKKKSTFSRIQAFFIWFMLIVTVLGVFISALAALNVF